MREGEEQSTTERSFVAGGARLANRGKWSGDVQTTAADGERGVGAGEMKGSRSHGGELVDAGEEDRVELMWMTTSLSKWTLDSRKGGQPLPVPESPRVWQALIGTGIIYIFP